MAGRAIPWVVGVGALGFTVLWLSGSPALGYGCALVALLALAAGDRPSLNAQIAVASAAGLALGVVDPAGVEQANVAFVGRLFVAALKMLIAPMILLSIVHAIAGMGTARDLGRLGSRTLLFYVGTMALAVATGLVFVNVFEPGAGAALRSTAFFGDAVAQAAPPAADVSLADSLARIALDAFRNPVSSLAEGRILPVVVFAVLLGLALLQIGEPGRPLVEVLGAANAAVMRMIGWFIRLAPVGVSALLASLVATTGLATLAEHLGAFAAVVFGATAFHAFVTLPLVARVFAGIGPVRLFRSLQRALVVAFSTSSSAATLPVTTRCVEEELGVPREVSSFVLPLGATVNMDGTALYEAIAALFIANVYGVELGVGSQMVVFAVAMVSAMGAPGIPSAGMVTMVVVLEAVGLPAEAVGLLLTIDRLLDTARTMANVEGDAVVAACVAQAFQRADAVEGGYPRDSARVESGRHPESP